MVRKPERAEQMQNNECAKAHKHLVERRGGFIRLSALSPTDVIRGTDREDSTSS